MAKAFIDDTNLTAIANAIRAKTGSADTYLPSEMATAISNLQIGGGTSLDNIAIFIGDYSKDEIILESGCGAVNMWERVIVS